MSQTTTATTTTTVLSPSLPTLGKDAVPYKSQWKRTTDVPLTRENLLDVLYGRTPTIKEAGFLTPEQCFKFEKELSHKISPYKHYTGPLLQKVGVAQFEYQAQAAEDFKNRGDEKDQYFKEATRWHDLHDKLAASTGVNAWEKVISTLRGLLPDYEVIVASEGPDKKYFSGIYRALNESTHIHCDWSPYDSLTEDWILNKVTHQAVFNLYMAPVVGGRTFVHDVQWTEECLKFRDPASYGYFPEVTAGRQKAIVSPQPGDLCFFNSRNMHEVEKVDPVPCPELGLPYRPRLTLSSFMGVLPAEKEGGKPRLILWS
ncbi:hypothetical protein F4809DRAFT_655278 [Biscogniauxia mediterranea]|nr:hypothetical protein F4809DRAFT_655278 [Biscogniauxia mediterranea]